MFSLLPLADGRLLVGTEHGAYIGDARGFAPLHPGLAAYAITRLWRDDDGSVWAGTNNNGLARVAGGQLEWLDIGKGLPNNRVLALRRDREGSLWVGTNGGLARVRTAPIHTYTRADGLADDFVRATLVDRDRPDLDRQRAGAGSPRSRRPAAITRIGLGARLADVSVLSLAQDAQGDVLVGTFHDGLLRLHDGQLAGTLTMDSGLPANEVRAMLPARDGRLWIGTKQGLVVRDGIRSRIYNDPRRPAQRLRPGALRGCRRLGMGRHRRGAPCALPATLCSRSTWAAATRCTCTVSCRRPTARRCGWPPTAGWCACRGRAGPVAVVGRAPGTAVREDLHAGGRCAAAGSG